MHYWTNDKTRRYYRADVVRDLWGGLVVVRTTGAMDSRRGRVMSFPVADAIEADKMLTAVINTRIKNGYAEKSCPPVNPSKPNSRLPECPPRAAVFRSVFQ